MSKIRVAVLMGGRSAERQVSLSTGRQVMEALDPERYEAIAVDTAAFGMGTLASPEPPPPGQIAAHTATDTSLPLAATTDPLAMLHGAKGFSDGGRPDVALICLHGKYGEDGTVQGMLELLNIPYCGSGVLASALAMSKAMAKKIFRVEGIPTPASVTLRGRAEVDAYRREVAAGTAAVTVPLVVKPDTQGSTIGLSVVRESEDLHAALETALAFDNVLVIEQFVEGMEITGPVLGNDDPQCLPLVEIVPQGGFYDYEAKYTPGATEEIVPARLSPELTRQAQELAVRAHQALGCRGFSRTDMLVGDDGVWVLEVNTIPGMTPTSLLPRSAEAAGISFPRLVERMIDLALEGSTSESTSAPSA